MESIKNSVVKAQLGVAGVPAQGCYARPWAHVLGGHVLGGVSIAPKSAPSLEQNSVVMTAAVATAPRKDDFARSGIRTQGPPV
ncbi:hypothetical protein [Sporichthya sp.]|uniref:hypothetical protein n=1 Tax=Sporichthya sp. TaxID=65475 RepID=UPI00178EFCF8|nr:hypothetical protein [Sporichthya sp.]MBA3745580.1 hypothetical protein [Sporichthya sp.]